MARIRTIKPEFWTDEKVVELSFEARLLFIGLWNFCDEFGNTESSVKRIKMQIFPADNIDVESCLQEIRSVGFLSDYEVDGKKYIHINGFEKHQKVNRNVTPKYPRPNFEKLSPQSDKKPVEKEKEKEKEQKQEKSDKSDYRFFGETIRLNENDYEKIKGQYPNLDIDEQLKQLDLELRNKKNWFVEMNSKLNYRNKTETHQTKARARTAAL